MPPQPQVDPLGDISDLYRSVDNLDRQIEYCESIKENLEEVGQGIGDLVEACQDLRCTLSDVVAFMEGLNARLTALEAANGASPT